MGFRFRRSFKIAPGLRVNVGKKGMSLSAGVRGARVTVGTSRVTASAGIPGTGISFVESKSISTRSSRAGREADTSYMTPKQLEKHERFREQSANVDDEQSSYEKFVKIAADSPALYTKDDFNAQLNQREFCPEIYGLSSVPEKEYIKSHVKKSADQISGKPVGYGISCLFLGWITWGSIEPFFLAIGWGLVIYGVFTSVWKGQKIRNEAKALFAENAKDVAAKRAAHPSVEQERIQNLQRAFSGSSNEIENAAQSALDEFTDYAANLRHAFEMNASFEFSGDGRIQLDTDLPEIEDVVVEHSKKVLKSGEVKLKEKKSKEKNLEYAHGAIGLAFNLAARMFNVSPAVSTVIVTGFTQKTDKATGNIRDHYVYEISFERTKFQDLNLAQIDPLESLKLFDHKLKFTTDKEMQEIEIPKSA